MSNRNRKIMLLVSVLYLCVFMVGCGGLAAGAGNVINEIAVIVGGLIPVAAAFGDVLLPTEAVAINAGATLAQKGIKALEGVIADYKANPSDTTLQKVTAAMTDVQSNLLQLEQAAAVKDPVAQAKVTAIVNAAQQSLAAVESSIAANHPKVVAAAQA